MLSSYSTSNYKFLNTCLAAYSYVFFCHIIFIMFHTFLILFIFTIYIFIALSVYTHLSHCTTRLIVFLLHLFTLFIFIIAALYRHISYKGTFIYFAFLLTLYFTTWLEIEFCCTCVCSTIVCCSNNYYFKKIFKEMKTQMQ